MRHALLRFHRDEGGGSFAEAVIVLPAFILVWSLILFVHTGYENAADAGVQVRRVAWEHSLGGCEEDVEDPVSMSEGNLWSAAVGSAASLLEAGAGWGDIIMYQPLVLSEAGLLLNPPGVNTYSVSDTVDRPAALGGSARYGHEFTVTCDEQPSDYTFGLWIATSWAVVMADVVY